MENTITEPSKTNTAYNRYRIPCEVCPNCRRNISFRVKKCVCGMEFN